VVGIDPLMNSLFARPAWGSYYFGDYYGRSYASRGFQPWYRYGARAGDPLFSFYRWQNRANSGWADGLRSTYLDRLTGDLARPPRTLSAQTTLLAATTGNKSNLQVVSPLGKMQNSDIKLTRVNSSQLAAQKAQTQRFSDVSRARSRVETADRLATNTSGRSARSLGSFNLANPRNNRTTTVRSFNTGSNQMPRVGTGTNRRNSETDDLTFTPRGRNGSNSSSNRSSSSSYRPSTYAPAYRPPISSSYRPAPSYRPGPSYGGRMGGGGYRGGGGSRGGGGGHGGHR
jgi:hypothetical protein